MSSLQRSTSCAVSFLHSMVSPSVALARAGFEADKPTLLAVYPRMSILLSIEMDGRRGAPARGGFAGDAGLCLVYTVEATNALASVASGQRRAS